MIYEQTKTFSRLDSREFLRANYFGLRQGYLCHISDSFACNYGNLLAECYVATSDIGLLQKGMHGRLRVDAFNYNQWGVLEGNIEDISKDVVISNGNSSVYYKVYCSLDSHCLHLKNGYEGCVKKGMSVSARFIVTRRTLFQLLYDKVDDWINPTIN